MVLIRQTTGRHCSEVRNLDTARRAAIKMLILFPHLQAPTDCFQWDGLLNIARFTIEITKESREHCPDQDEHNLQTAVILYHFPLI
jgi:hypothetical protein